MPALMFEACQPPFAAGSIKICPEPVSFGFTDVTSNAALGAVDGCCARSGRTAMTPMTNGAAMAAEPAAASRHFFHIVNRGCTSVVMMYSILFLRSEPVTPDTQAS